MTEEKGKSKAKSKAKSRAKSKAKSKAKSRAKSKNKSRAKSRAKSKQKSKMKSKMKSMASLKKKGGKKGHKMMIGPDGRKLEARIFNFMSLPFTGYFRDGYRRVDLVIVIRDDGVGKNEKVKMLYFAQLCKMGLILELEQGQMAEHNHLLFIKVHAPDIFIAIHGELFMYFKLFKDIRVETMEQSATDKMLPFTSALSDKGFVTLMRDNYPGPPGYSTLDRSYIVYDVLTSTRLGGIYGYNPLQRMVQLNLITDVFALHDGPFFLVENQETDKINARQILFETWTGISNLIKYQPLHIINEYLGDRVAMFFAFYGFLNLAMAMLALMGLMVFAADELHKSESVMTQIICSEPTFTNTTNRRKYLTLNKFICPNCKYYDICPYAMVNDFCKESRVNDHVHTLAKTFVYPTVVFIWSCLLLKLWRRQERNFFWQWEIDKGYMDDVRRIHAKGFQFHKEMSAFIRILRFVYHCALLTLLVLLAKHNVYLFLYWRYALLRHLKFPNIEIDNYYKKNYYVISFITISNCGLVFVFERAFAMLIFYMPHWERLKSPISMDKSIAYKLTALTLLTLFNIPFYFAFIKGQFYTYPIDMKIWRKWYGILVEKCDPRSCMDEVLIIMVTILYMRELVFKFVPCMKILSSHIDYSDLGVVRSVRTPHWEREKALKSSMETEKFIMLKYRDLVVQMATMTLFARVFPLAPLVILVTNALDIRVCARRILLYSRRPILRRHLGIGAWYNVLLALLLAIALFQVLLGTITSEAILQFTYLSTKNDSVVDHLNFVPFEKFRIYAYTAVYGPNVSVDDSYELGYLTLKCFPEYDYQAIEKEKGEDTPLHHYLRNIENNFGQYRPSCSCTTFLSHKTVKSTNDYDLMPRRTCYFKGYWRRYTNFIKRGRYVGMTTGSKLYYNALARLGRNAANVTGSIMGYFFLGFLSPVITVPVNAIFRWKTFYWNYFKRFMDVYFYSGYAENWKAYALSHLKWYYTLFSLVIFFVIFSAIFWLLPDDTMQVTESQSVEYHVRHYASGQTTASGAATAAKTQ